MHTEGIRRRRVGIHESKGIRWTEKAADRAVGSVAYFSSGRAYNDDARANLKEAYRGRSSPARNILSASLAFHAGHQTMLLPATKRFTLFSVRSLAAPLPATQWKTDGEKKKKKEKRTARQKNRFLSKYTSPEIPLSSTIRYLFVLTISAGMLRFPFPALFLSPFPVCFISTIIAFAIDRYRFPD